MVCKNTVLGCDNVAWEKFVPFSEESAAPNIRVGHKRQSVRLHSSTCKQTVFFLVSAVIISSVFDEIQVLSNVT